MDIITDLKNLRSNTYEHGIPIGEHIASRAIAAIESLRQENERLREAIVKLAVEDHFGKRRQVARKALGETQ